jgi:hypothetical protein
MTVSHGFERELVAGQRIQTFGEVSEHPYMVGFGVKQDGIVIYWRMPMITPSNDDPAPVWVLAHLVPNRGYEWCANLHAMAYEKLLEHFGLFHHRPNIQYKEAQYRPPIYFAQLRRSVDRECGIPWASVREIKSIDKNYPISAMFCR